MIIMDGSACIGKENHFNFQANLDKKSITLTNMSTDPYWDPRATAL